MKNMNKNSINLGFKMLSILAFCLIFIPLNKAAAVYPTYVIGGFNNDNTYTLGHFIWSDDSGAVIDNGNGGSISGSGYGSTNRNGNNPVPRISSISPKSGDVNMKTNVITVTGSNFTPSSLVRFNTATRAATFIDPSHLLVSINSNDLYSYQNNGGFFVTVFNGAPGGGYSNAVYFTIKDTGASGSANKGGGSLSGSLTATAFLGSGSILPSGLAAWIALGILILIIIILVRKVFGAEKRYHETPLKHA